MSWAHTREVATAGGDQAGKFCEYPHIIYPIDNPSTYAYTRPLLPTSGSCDKGMVLSVGIKDADSEFGTHKL